MNSAVLHADETSWRVAGKTYWLWAFANQDLTYYLIDRSRGEPALLRFFVEEFQGTLVTDFWGAYNAVVCAARQGCLVHLLRDLHSVDHYKKGGAHWPEFAKKLRRLVGDAIRLGRQKPDLPPEGFASRRQRLDERLEELITTPWEDKQAKRLVKRLRRHRDDLFTSSTNREFRSTTILRSEPLSSGDHSQEQLRQSQRARSGRSSSPDDTLSHAYTTRT